MDEEIVKRASISSDLNNYCYMAKDFDFIEVTEWFNTEGVDISIMSGLGHKTISLTYGEIDAIKKLSKKLLKATR